MERPADTLCSSCNVTDDHEAERVTRRVRKPKLAERNAELGNPSKGVYARCDVPYGVPARILVVVIVNVEVALHSSGIDTELVPGAAIMIRIDHQLELLRLSADI